MVRNAWYLIIGLSLTTLLVNGCAKDVGECRGSLANGQNGACLVVGSGPLVGKEPVSILDFRCTATLNNASNQVINTIAANELVSLKIEATGGTAPYSVPSLVSSFASITSIAGSYANTTTVDRVVEKKIEVRDSNNNIANCSFSVVVKPVGTSTISSSGLGCDIEVTPIQPRTGQLTHLKVKVINGVGATSFRQLYPQLNWNAPEWTVPVTKISDTEGQVVGGIQYTNTGDRIVTTSIENNSRVAICSKRITVANPQLQVVSTVGTVTSQVAAMGSEFKLKAIPNGMTGTLTYQFTTTEAGINITTSADTATVKATDLLYHNFKVSVLATSSNGETAASETWLKYTSSVPLVCRLELTGSAIVNSSVGFRVVADSGEAIEINDIIAPVLSVPSSHTTYTNPFSLVFPTTGIKVVSVKAQSITSKVPCNVDTRMGVVFTVMERQVVCNVSTGVSNTAATGTVSKIQVTVPTGGGTGPFELLDVRSSLAETSFYDKDVNALWQKVSFRRPGSHTVTAKIKDRFDGKIGECSVVHIAKIADAFAAGTDRNAEPRVNVFGGANAILARSFLAFDSSFTGGVRVAMGDVNGDGVTDVIAGAGNGLGSRIRVFKGADLTLLRDFEAFPGVAMQGVYAGAGDVDGDGKADIVAGSGCLAPQARVRIYSGETQAVLGEIFPYGSAAGGARVAIGDVNGDGRADIVTAPCNGSDIHIYSGRDFSMIRGIIAYANDNRDSQIAVGDVNGDGFADIVAGSHDDWDDHKFSKVFDGRTGMMLFSIAAFTDFDKDARVAVGDVTGDGIAEILIGAGGLNPSYPEIKTFDGRSGIMLGSPAGYFKPFGSAYRTNLFLGAGVGGL